jgi:hypothetical protein
VDVPMFKDKQDFPVVLGNIHTRMLESRVLFKYSMIEKQKKEINAGA